MQTLISIHVQEPSDLGLFEKMCQCTINRSLVLKELMSMVNVMTMYTVDGRIPNERWMPVHADQEYVIQISIARHNKFKVHNVSYIYSTESLLSLVLLINISIKQQENI